MLYIWSAYQIQSSIKKSNTFMIYQFIKKWLDGASNLVQRTLTYHNSQVFYPLRPISMPISAMSIIYYIHVYQVKQNLYSPVLMRLLHISSYNFKYSGMMRTQFVWIKGHIDGSVDLLVGIEDHFGFLGNPWCIREGRRGASKVDGHQVSRKSLSLPNVH